MKGSATILQFLENSSENGLGFMVVVVLFYLFIFFLIQYFQHKKLFFLLYSLYTLVSGIGLLRYIKGVFFTGFFESDSGRSFSMWIHYPTQLLGTLLFTYFIIHIMRLKEKHPKAIRIIGYYYLIVSPVYLMLYGLQMANPRSYLIDYFHGMVYIPTGYIIFFWVFHMVYKQKMMIKKYIFTGMFVLGTTYLLLFISTIKNVRVNDQYLYILYLGILVESLLFALAIGLEQKLVYMENDEIQKKYISQLEENQIITDSMNRTLSEELEQTKSNVVELTAEAHRERTEKLTIAFENKFSQLKLDALRSQMSPHFIFNAINSIKSYFIENDREKAIYFLTKFSKLIRNILESSRKEQISLEEELDILKVYVEIENNRFKNDIHFKIEVEEDLRINKIMVPPLFLQPFVENAIWHGLLTKKGEKNLTIRIHKNSDSKMIKIEIEDNGIGREAVKLRNTKNVLRKESLGLSLTKDRMELFSKKLGKPLTYCIKDLYSAVDKKATGTLVEVNIPRAA
ncbi:sensor histidine kinase [Flagellimonas meridianipacifica]|uniref:7TM protein involved in diverse intracellular signaling n=1 Tax=Flagellimonas meridianipacifica TaxID=1080225 RepID=A0A2T0MHI3_9FLAO|nr:histidine kinase [Allomuricauda pacifica]PRX57022.1 7TM protein involved in diverse intracellular signaling [Allomuricauda pacifica]